MIKRTFYGVIKTDIKPHKFVQHDPGSFQNFLDGFEKDREMEFEIRPKYKKRTQGLIDESTNFNGYYWKFIVAPIADEMGELDHDYVHKIIQIQIGNFNVDKFGVKHPRETKEMSGGEFSEMCAKARMWAAIPGNVCELGIRLREPNEAPDIEL